MRTLLLIFVCMLSLSAVVTAQHAIAERIQSIEPIFSRMPIIQPFIPIADYSRDINLDFSQFVEHDILLEINQDVFRQLRQNASYYLALEVPVSDYQNFDLLLYRVEITTPAFQIFRGSDRSAPLRTQTGIHYRGIVNGDEESFVSISIFQDEIMGLIAVDEGNIVIGQIPDSREGIHIVYNDREFRPPDEFICMTSDDGPGYTLEEISRNPMQRDLGDCVKVFIEVDYPVLERKGGITNTVNYIQGLFNECITLYAADDITLILSEMVIWDTPSPYSGQTTHEMLSSYQSNTGAFNGDIAHFISLSGNGGVAGSIGGICSTNIALKKCYSSLPSTYKVFPAFSFAVQLLTHEMGHLLGSRHTHACVWYGNNTAIDGCAPAEGSCPLPPLPPEGGTIMSYCFADSVGLDLNLGFGPQPGNVIRNTIAEANNCLTPCETIIYPDDAGIVLSLKHYSSFCDTMFSPLVTMKNYGSNTLNSATINYFIDDNLPDSYLWTGILESGESISVELPEIAHQFGFHSFTAYTIDPNGQPDPQNENDADTQEFSSGNNQLILTIHMDAFQFETDWLIRNGNGEILKGGNTYEMFYHDYETISDTFCLPEGCYFFENYDNYGNGICCENGEGAYQLVDLSNGTILANGGQFGFEEITTFCVPSDIYTCNLNEMFPENSLTHVGPGATSTILSLSGFGQYASFTISDIDQKLNGNPNNRYIDQVSVSYIDTNGVEFLYGQYNGSSVSTADIFITRSVESIDVSLENSYSNNASVTISIGEASFCGENPECSDSDNDSVCNEDDLCPGFDDLLDLDNDNIPDDCDPCVDPDNDGVCNPNDICPGGDDTIDFDGDTIPDACDNCPADPNVDQEDSDGDGIGDACDTGNCSNEIISDFDPNPLTHTGGGSSIVNLDLGGVPHTDITFTISNIDEKLNGNPNRRFIDEVDVYVDGNLYAQASGSQQNTLDVEIPGPAQLIEVLLNDGLDGTMDQGQMSIQFSSVTSCADIGALIEKKSEKNYLISDSHKIIVYPNPAKTKITVQHTIKMVTVDHFSSTGIKLAQYTPDAHRLTIPLEGFSSGIYFLKIRDSGDAEYLERFVVLR